MHRKWERIYRLAIQIVFVDLSRETIKQSPEYTDESMLNRDYESKLHGHYNRQGYWVEEADAGKHSK